MGYVNKWSVGGTAVFALASFLYSFFSFFDYVEYPVGMRRDWLAIVLVTLVGVVVFHVLYLLVFLIFLRKR
jgi:hypothetical protein